MKLHGPTRLVIEVDPSTFRHAGANRDNLHYLLDRLWSGEEVAVRELEAWGLRVRETIPPEDWMPVSSVGH